MYFCRKIFVNIKTKEQINVVLDIRNLVNMHLKEIIKPTVIIAKFVRGRNFANIEIIKQMNVWQLGTIVNTDNI